MVAGRMGDPLAGRPLDGSAYAPRLGLHLHVGMREGKLAEVRIRRAPHEGPVSPAAEPILARLARHAQTGREDFRDVALDLSSVSGFDREALSTLAREVPAGEVVTYGELARMLGRGPGAARAVGGAMARNQIPIVVPCHRVVPGGSRIGNYSGEGGWETKMALLRIERAKGVWVQRTL